MGSDSHPLREVLEAAALGHFPTPDGSVTVLPQGRTAAIVGFTMRHYVLTDLPEVEVREHLDPDNFAAPMLAPFTNWFAERQGLRTRFLDIVLARLATGGESTLARSHPQDWSSHARVGRALNHREDIEVWTSPERDQLAIFGEGIAGRLELSVEIDPVKRGGGLAVALIDSAMGTRPAGTPVFAQVSPGNVASLRAFLRADFKPVCSEVIFTPLEGATVPA